MTKRVMFMLAATKTKCVKKNNLGADVALRQDEDVLDTVLLRAVDLLHARLAGKTPTHCASSTQPA
ncbi:hypothetical protein DMI70_03420 [Escherichia coli]|nr:hypothetical protein [Escherichia coli]